MLGSLRVWRDETAVELGPVQQRVVLAVLALQEGRPVGLQQIISAVWGEAPPRHAVNLVQRHVSGLRRVLEPSRPGRTPSDLLTWTEAGYQLAMPAGSLDLAGYESELARARALQLMRKGVRASQNVNLLRWTQYYDIDVDWNLLWGSPARPSRITWNRQRSYRTCGTCGRP